MTLVQQKVHGRAANPIEIVDRLIRRNPTQLRILASAIADHTASLYAEEAAAIASASQSRRLEFSTGRWLARQALDQLGLPVVSIPVGAAREPLWPPGVVASLTHSRRTCVVAMGEATVVRSVGIDLELADTVDVELAPSILCATETQLFDSSELLRLAFSAKEAVFKSLFPRYREFVDYSEVAIEIDAETRTFSAVAQSQRLESLGIQHGIGLYETDDAGVLTLFIEESSQAHRTMVTAAGRRKL